MTLCCEGEEASGFQEIHPEPVLSRRQGKEELTIQDKEEQAINDKDEPGIRNKEYLAVSANDLLFNLEAMLQKHHDRLEKLFEAKQRRTSDQSKAVRNTFHNRRPGSLGTASGELAALRTPLGTPISSHTGLASRDLSIFGGLDRVTFHERNCLRDVLGGDAEGARESKWESRWTHHQGPIRGSMDAETGKAMRHQYHRQSAISSFSQFEQVHRAVTLGAGKARTSTSRRAGRHSATSNQSLLCLCGCCQHIKKACKAFLASKKAELLVSVLILSNVVFAGVEVEYMAQSREQESHPVMWWVSAAYALMFTMELVMRLVAEGRTFCWNGNFGWNLFDSCVVSISLVEMMLGIIGLDASQLPSLRAIRMARVVRVLRIARVKHFRSLRILMYSVMNTLRSLLWTMLLLFMVLYVFAILFTQAAVAHLVAPSQDIPYLDAAYGSVGRSIYTLFKAVTGGVSWEAVAEPLGQLHPMWFAAYLVYFAFTYFAVLNVVTGVFCQTAIEGAHHDQEVAAQAQMLEKQKYVDRLQKLFEKININNTGEITLLDLEASLSDEKLRAYFESIDLTVDEAFSLFKLLDREEKHVLDIDTFVTGCLKLRGHAKSIEIAIMMYETRWCMQRCVQGIRMLENSISGAHNSESFMDQPLNPTPEERVSECLGHAAL